MMVPVAWEELMGRPVGKVPELLVLQVQPVTVVQLVRLVRVVQVALVGALSLGLSFLRVVLLVWLVRAFFLGKVHLLSFWLSLWIFWLAHPALCCLASAILPGLCGLLLASMYQQGFWKEAEGRLLLRHLLRLRGRQNRRNRQGLRRHLPILLF
jgi:hypothetical protein